MDGFSTILVGEGEDQHVLGSRPGEQEFVIRALISQSPKEIRYWDQQLEAIAQRLGQPVVLVELRRGRAMRHAVPKDEGPPALSVLPVSVRQALLGYVRQHREPGEFLRSVLANRLAQTVLQADPTTLAAIGALVRYLNEDVPARAWGSEGAVAAWLRQQPEEAAQ